MNRIGDDRPVRAVPEDTLRPNRVQTNTPVSVPLDFLQGISTIAQRSLEKQPPKLKIKKRGGAKNTENSVALSDVSPIASQETSEVAYQIVEMVIRRKEEIEQSGDLSARRGLASLERIIRMFEHIYTAGSAAGQNEKLS